MSKRATSPTLSASVQTIAEQLGELSISKTEFARLLGVSPDYVYRILKGRVPFPRVRETIERMAEILRLDPHVFLEYRELEQALSTSTRLVWQRMKELRLDRDDLFTAMGGRISRPYFNSILRGDQPFPSNRAYIQLFALALDLPPSVFKEYGRAATARWSDDDVKAIEEQFYNLLFDKMLADQGFAKAPIKLDILEPVAMGVFPPREKRAPELVEILRRMGDLGMGVPELEKVSGVPATTLRSLLASERVPAAAAEEVAAIRQALRIG
jgi:transcriptional regulator with XRE-family HTH domain